MHIGGRNMTIRDSFLAFADKNHLPVKEKQENGTSIFSFQISGEKGKYGAYAMCLEDERMLTFFVDCNIRVEESQRKIINTYLMELNYQLKLGTFQLDPTTGDITVRACQYIFGNEAEQKFLVERVVLLCGLIADHYCHDIIKHLPE